MRDARISGALVNSLVTATLQGLGINVVDLELSTTPTCGSDGSRT